MLTIDRPAKTHAEVLAYVRQKIIEMQAVDLLTPDGAQQYETQMLLLLGEVERLREQAEKEAHEYIEKYHYALGRRQGITALRSMLEQLMHASIVRAKADLQRQHDLTPAEPRYVDALTQVQRPGPSPQALAAARASRITPQDVPMPEWPCACGAFFRSQRARAEHAPHCPTQKPADASVAEADPATPGNAPAESAE